MAGHAALLTASPYASPYPRRAYTPPPRLALSQPYTPLSPRYSTAYHPPVSYTPLVHAPYSTPSKKVRSRGDATSSLGDATSSLGDTKSSLGDAESSLGGAESTLGDAASSLGDAASSLGDAKRSRWVTLRARWVTLRARWVTLRARWVTPRDRWVTLQLAFEYTAAATPARSVSFSPQFSPQGGGGWSPPATPPPTVGVEGGGGFGCVALTPSCPVARVRESTLTRPCLVAWVRESTTSTEFKPGCVLTRSGWPFNPPLGQKREFRSEPCALTRPHLHTRPR
jgi:hypothetical protein